MYVNCSIHVRNASEHFEVTNGIDPRVFFLIKFCTTEALGIEEEAKKEVFCGLLVKSSATSRYDKQIGADGVESLLTFSLFVKMSCSYLVAIISM